MNCAPRAVLDNGRLLFLLDRQGSGFFLQELAGEDGRFLNFLVTLLNDDSGCLKCLFRAG